MRAYEMNGKIEWNFEFVTAADSSSRRVVAHLLLPLLMIKLHVIMRKIKCMEIYVHVFIPA